MTKTGIGRINMKLILVTAITLRSSAAANAGIINTGKRSNK